MSESEVAEPDDHVAAAGAAATLRGTMTRSARTMLSRSGLAGTAVEAAWIAAHVVSYPFGVAQERVRPDVERFSLGGLPPIHRGLLIGDVEAAGTPILLVHGLVDNRSIFTLLRRHLRRRGFGRVSTLNYRIWTTDLRVAARELGEAIELVCEQTGYERLHVIGHSMGGLLARYYVQRLGGDARVHTLVTLGTPHHGTRAARLFPRGICQQMAPGSELVAELAEPAPDCQTRFVSFWSDIDAIISPKQSARLDHPDLSARNILVRGVGHMSLPIDRRIVHEIAATLAHLDSDGGTVTAGVTRLEPPAPDLAGSMPGRIRTRLRPTRRARSVSG
ncbi:MAG TPA: alpha/beta fold hydrolase [Mycobacteriales bacterium]|nr:alpha/beta fold hydrolase [Mycobacteriales bacterium]